MKQHLERWAWVGLALLSACGGSAARRNGSPTEAEAGQPSVIDGGPELGGGAATGGAAATGGSSVASGATASAAHGGRPVQVGGAGSAGSATGTCGEPSNAPSLILPPGCEQRSGQETETSCSLTAYCSVQSQVAHCDRLASGLWQCRCEQYPGRTYEVEGAAGLQACAVAAGACSTHESELAAESCEVRSDHARDDYCWMTLGCTREVRIGFVPTARAWLVREGKAQCRLSDSGESFGCHCVNGEHIEEYDLFASSGQAACRPLVDFCMSGAQPLLSGEERCVLASATSTNDGCERQVDCSQLMPLADGVELARLQQRYVTCSAREDGGSDCYCSTVTEASEIQAVDAPPSDASCASAMSLCPG